MNDEEDRNRELPPVVGMFGRRVINDGFVGTLDEGLAALHLHRHDNPGCPSVRVHEFDLAVDADIRVGRFAPDESEIGNSARKAAYTLALLLIVLSKFR